MEIALFVIFIVTDIIVIASFAYAFGQKGEYRKGLLLGMHVNEENLSNPDVVELIQKYKKQIKRYNIISAVTGIAVCGLCFADFTFFLFFWMIWLVFAIAAGMITDNISQRKMYEIKIKNNWNLTDASLSTESADNDEYWKKGWYSNPHDPHLFIQDRISSTNYVLNMARPGAKIFIGAVTAFTIACIGAVVIMIAVMDNAHIAMSVENNTVKIDAVMYDMEFDVKDIKSVEVINELPEENMIRTNGGATKNYLVGNFKGKETGRCKLYIFKGYKPVLKIELEDETVYINSKNSDEVAKWFEMINTKVKSEH